MVGKLIKHELHSTVRVAAIPAIIMILLAVLARIMLSTSNTGLTIITVMFYVFSIIATLLIGFYFGIYSFYQSLFTSTGYLTLSLPVTPDQLIWSKLISAITVMFASIIICILSSLIFLLGTPKDVIDEIFILLAKISELIGTVANRDPLFFAELAIDIVVSIPVSFLVFYAVMSVGQLFTVKNRKGISILLYIGLCFIWSMLQQTIFNGLIQKMLEISIHLVMWVQIAFNAAVTVGCYFLVRYIIKNKVNLLA